MWRGVDVPLHLLANCGAEAIYNLPLHVGKAGQALMKSIIFAAALAASFTLAGCGGDAPPAAPVALPPPAQEPAPVPPVQPPAVPPAESPVVVPPVTPPAEPPPDEAPLAFLQHWNLCKAPRVSPSPAGRAYPDRQGTLDNELSFLRGWLHDSYLWYREIPAGLRQSDYTDPIAWFNVLKTPQLTASGKPKDRYHFTYNSDRYDELSTKGVDLGYGVAWSRVSGQAVPRTWLATTVEPGSPAAAAGLRRGDMLVNVDGVDFVKATGTAEVAVINAGLFPTAAGQAHQFVVRRGSKLVAAAMSSAKVESAPVKNTKVIDTPTGKVGYLTFATHNSVSELQLMESFATLQQAGVTDLVLDVRYNGGGLLYIASELAYMIAGPQATAGKIFERSIHNDKTTPYAPFEFRSSAYGFTAPRQATAGTPLPYLGLRRVTLLTTPGTCSASESIINSLRGIDVEVNLIGGDTCGKPYAFTPVPNCGTTYFAIEFRGVNEKGFGDYADGFAPTCRVADDLSKEMGDPEEGLLAAALSYRASGVCPAPAARARALPLELVRDPVHEIAVYPRTR